MAQKSPPTDNVRLLGQRQPPLALFEELGMACAGQGGERRWALK